MCCVQLIATVLVATSFSAAAQARDAFEDELIEDVRAAAARVLPFDVRSDIGVGGADADGKTLLILLKTERDIPSKEYWAAQAGALFGSACLNFVYADLMSRGATVRYDIDTPTGQIPGVLRLTSSSCGQVSVVSAPHSQTWAIFQRVAKNGLEQTLLEIVEESRSELIFDGVAIESVSADFWTLDVSVTLDSLLVASDWSLQDRFVHFACNDYTLRTLLMAGTKLNYRLADPQYPEEIRLTYRDCWDIEDLTKGAKQ